MEMYALTRNVSLEGIGTTMDSVEGNSTKPLEYYLSLPYTIRIKEVDGHHLATVDELPGLFVWADTLEEIPAQVNEGMLLWIKTAIEQGNDIPEPPKDEDYSGKVLTRMPKSLHRLLAQEARRQGVSLNQYVVAVLSNQVKGRL